MALDDLRHRDGKVQLGIGKRRLDTVFVSEDVKCPKACDHDSGDFYQIANPPDAIAPMFFLIVLEDQYRTLPISCVAVLDRSL
jgi:hypothetical protein